MKSILTQIDELNNIIRELHKIDSKLQAGQFIAAYRENRRIISILENNKKAILDQENKSTTGCIETLTVNHE